MHVGILNVCDFWIPAPEKNCWTNNVVQHCLSNDEATRLFMAVGTRKTCIDRTTMFITAMMSEQYCNNIVNNLVHAGHLRAQPRS